MRIVFLSRYQNKVERGVENFVKELAKKLSFNHRVDIFYGPDSDSLKKILDGHFDVVIPTNGRMQSFKVSLGRIFGSYKMLISGHSGIGRDDIWNIVVCKPDVFVALTSMMEKWAKNWAWGSKVVRIPNGIDLGKFNPIGQKINLDLEQPIILTAGVLNWYKHHERAVEVVARLQKGSLVIAGKGKEKNELEKLGKEKLGKRFKLIDASYEDMPILYRSVDLFTLPSWDREAFGLVYLEALASNIPVVAPNDDSRKEIVEEGGLLVDVYDYDKYVAAIEKALKKNWGNLPRKQAEKFSWDKIAVQYEKVLLDLTTKP